MIIDELRALYHVIEEINDKYPDQKDWFRDQVNGATQYNIAMIFADYLNNVRSRENRAIRLIMASVKLIDDFEQREDVEDAVSNLFMLLLENAPTLYTDLNKAFYRLVNDASNEETKEVFTNFKHEVDGIQVGIKEKEYKTPFYNVIETKQEIQNEKN